MTTQDFYNEIYGEMKNSKEKGYKIILKKDLQTVLLVNIYRKGIIFHSNDEKYDFIYSTKLSVNSLITNILLQEGSRGKIKLRNFFSRNNKNLWRGKWKKYCQC